MNNLQKDHTSVAKAIEELEDYFFQEKEGQLYKFLLGIMEKSLIESVLRQTEGNQLKAAKVLGINRNTLHSKIKSLNIDTDNFKFYKTGGGQ